VQKSQAGYHSKWWDQRGGIDLNALPRNYGAKASKGTPAQVGPKKQDGRVSRKLGGMAEKIHLDGCAKMKGGRSTPLALGEPSPTDPSINGRKGDKSAVQ